MGKLKLSYEADVDINGTMLIDNRSRMVEDLKQFKLRRIVIEIYQKVKKRTSPQNAYYWAVVVPILTRGFLDVGYSGMTDKKTHSWMKRKYLLGEEVSDIEEMPAIEIIGSTTKLDVIRFFEIMEDLQRFGAQILGVKIPDPDKNWRNREHQSYSDNIRL